MGDWQEVWDENTGCYYYWNTQSNEVTWELPQYLATQVQGLQHYQHRWARPPAPPRDPSASSPHPSSPLFFLSSTTVGANGSFVATEPYPQEKGGGRGAGLAKREVKKVSWTLGFWLPWGFLSSGWVGLCEDGPRGAVARGQGAVATDMWLAPAGGERGRAGPLQQ